MRIKPESQQTKTIIYTDTWRRHVMKTISSILAFCVESTGHQWPFLHKVPVMRSLDAQLWYGVMMTSSNGNIFRLPAICAGNSPLTGEFPAQRPVTRSFDVFFDLRLNKRLSKQSWGWWFETPSRSLWRQSNGADVCSNQWHRCNKLSSEQNGRYFADPFSGILLRETSSHLTSYK